MILILLFICGVMSFGYFDIYIDIIGLIYILFLYRSITLNTKITPHPTETSFCISLMAISYVYLLSLLLYCIVTNWSPNITFLWTALFVWNSRKNIYMYSNSIPQPYSGAIVGLEIIQFVKWGGWAVWIWNVRLILM